jgi:N-acetylglucosamine-6-sulfatase
MGAGRESVRRTVFSSGGKKMSRDSSRKITRRHFLKSVGAAGLTFPLTHSLRSLAADVKTRRRNILFILIDDMRFDSMSCMGHPFLKTPNLDRMAENGILFENGFVTTSLCSPSRASILTGQYAHIHGVLDNATLLPAGTETFPAALQKAGYETAFIGKWHMGGSTDEPRPGFDHWVSFRGQGTYTNPTFNVDGDRLRREGYVTDLITEYCVNWLKERKDKPFFLYMSHKAVHADFVPAPRHKDAFSDVKISHPPSMANTPENYEGKPLWVRRQRHSWHGVDYMYHDHTDFDRFIIDYHRTMLGVDDSVGTVMNTLDQLGLLDSTLVIFTSDNGFLHGEHGLIDKRCMYEESIKVPLIVHCPERVPGGRRSQRLVLNVDIVPTILDAAGLPIPQSVQGASFLPVACGESIPWRDAMLYEYFWERPFVQTPTVFGVRSERYKYCWYHGVFDLNELYDLREDPHEMRNLIDDPGCFGLRREMETKLRELVEQYGATMIPRFKR